MPEAQITHPSAAELSIDRRLIASLSLSLAGAGLEVFVGYIVAHWITLTANKTAGWLVSLGCFALVAAGGALAFNTQRTLGRGDPTAPHHGRRVFMASLALLVTAFSALVVTAATLILVTVRPND